MSIFSFRLLLFILSISLLRCTDNLSAYSVSSNKDSTTIDSEPYTLTPDSVLSNAYASQDTNLVLQVLVQGRVTRILADDTIGTRHQQFIIALNSGQTLKVAHNIDLAPRVSTIAVGKLMFAYGEYGYNSQGGYLHWTHRDPNGIHVDGWIECDGVKVQ